MAVRELSLESLKNLDDGRVLEAWRQALQRAVGDCDDRPGVLESRRITLELEIVPKMGEDGHVSTVNGTFVVKEKLPIRKSKVYEFAPRAGGKLAFNDMSDDDVAQRTLDEIGGFDVEGSN